MPAKEIKLAFIDSTGWLIFEIKLSVVAVLCIGSVERGFNTLSGELCQMGSTFGFQGGRNGIPPTG